MFSCRKLSCLCVWQPPCTTRIVGLKTKGHAEDVRSERWEVPGDLESLYLHHIFLHEIKKLFLNVLAILN